MRNSKTNTMRKAISLLAVLVLSMLLLTACVDHYSDYAGAYNKVTAKGGLDADLTATLTMDGSTVNCSGNFKVDTTKNIMYYTLTTGDDVITQYSDGTYLYTEQDGHKIRYSLNAKPEQNNAQDKKDKKETTGSVFNTSEFLKEFSSFLEAGKIREMGLFTPIAKAAVNKTEKSGDVYTLKVSETLVKQFLNTLAQNETGTGDTVQITKLENFGYSATVKDGIVTGVVYTGTVSVKVPASLMSSGAETVYSLDFNIKTSFNNPGTAVTIDIPSAEGYETI